MIERTLAARLKSCPSQSQSLSAPIGEKQIPFGNDSKRDEGEA
jgi:hypothetical protein